MIIIVPQVRRHQAPAIFMWQFLCFRVNVRQKKHRDRRVNDVAVTSCHEKRTKKETSQNKNGGKKHDTSCHHSPSAE